MEKSLRVPDFTEWSVEHTDTGHGGVMVEEKCDPCHD